MHNHLHNNFGLTSEIGAEMFRWQLLQPMQQMSKEKASVGRYHLEHWRNPTSSRRGQCVDGA